MLRTSSPYLYAALFLLIVAAYLPVWRNGFVDFDDDWYITRNPMVVSGLSWSGVWWALTTFHGSYLQPVTWLSLQLDSQLFRGAVPPDDPVLNPAGLVAAGFHAENVLWQAANVMLLFALWQKLTGARWRSFLLAALVGLHPMRVESVAWAVERKDVLAIFFGLLAMLAYVRYVEAPSRKRYALVLVAFVLSLLAKPILMTLPCVLLLLDYWPLGRLRVRSPGFGRSGPPERGTTNGGLSFGKLVMEKAPLFIGGFVLAAVAFVAVKRTGLPYDTLPLAARLVNVPAAYGLYLATTFWPLNLAVLYPHPGSNWEVLPVLVGGTALLVITAIALWQARRWPWLIVGWLWFVGTLVPVLGFAQTGEQARADRFTYWPHIGLFLIVVWGLAVAVRFIVSRSRARSLATGAVAATCAALAVLTLAVLTWRQTEYWHDPLTLWQRALAVTPRNPPAFHHLGKYYLDRGEWAQAQPYLARAVVLAPRTSLYHNSLGTVLLSLGKFEEARAQFRETIRLRKGLPTTTEDIEAWHRLGMSELYQGEAERAGECFYKVLELAPGLPDALVGLGRARLEQGRRRPALESFRAALMQRPQDAGALCGMGLALLADGDTSTALEYFTEALRLEPQMASADEGIGVVLARQNKWREAVEAHRRAVELANREEERARSKGGVPPPSDIARIHCGLAYALNGAGKPQAAMQEYREAFSRQVDWPQKFTARAWMLATHITPEIRDPQTAYELASQAAQGVADAPANTLDALAAAQAARGNFPAAVQTARSALRKARASQPTELADAIEGRLRLYETGKPFVKDPS